MKPPRFRYFAPTAIDEVVELLASHGDDAKLLAGGQSLVPLLNMRLTRPEVVIDLNRVADLEYLTFRDGGLAIGACTRQRAVERSDAVRERCPLLSEAVGHIGHVQIRNRGTVVGSIVHADPSAELPTVLTALGGWVTARGPQGDRRILADELFLTYFTTTVAPDEVVTEVVLDLPAPETGWSFQEVARRHGDFALVGVAAVAEVDGQGRFGRVRLAVAGCGGAPVRAASAEQAVAGHDCEDDVLRAAADVVADEVEPEGDIHASADYRRHVAGVLVTRCLRAAYARAGDGGEAA